MPEPKQTARKWDKFAIKAEINRRGKTLKQLALEGGLSESAVRMALKVRFPAAEKLITSFLQQPAHVLWPERYTDPKLTNVNRHKPNDAGLSSEDDQTGNEILVSREVAS